MWYGFKTNLEKLKVFGCIAYLHTLKQLILGKFNSRTKKCIFVGYCPHGYRLWCPKEMKIVYERNVIFNEMKTKLDLMEFQFYDEEIQEEQEYESEKEVE